MEEDLSVIPGVGESIKEDLHRLGYTTVESLKDEDPFEMYQRHNKIVGRTEDRCLLYVFRCAVYYASNSKHDIELLKWWNWKDK